ncbi:STAS domain-containing protein [Polaromonas sp. CG_9.11]|uniref:STAS domain-containing protein n=1 Tax=Polaromonas sp. CG_9.11 TaxID=2787730 RepID=UPI0018CA46A4|nr:STAS domain-containing protein [Polaromonas sp. CG_9.11]MBG6074760.1 ABC-type transporter Mla MlaB component [Polaromonas sp. CG_9.11]
MSKDDTASGLLSKLVKFVRNPATNWTELDSIDGDKDDAVTKQLLNEMIERKRRNDFVRKREFDMLRKLQKLEALSGTAADPGSRPSFFQSSLTSNVDDRATTLKKIDEIEAQMSIQWWKTKNQTASGAATEPAPLSLAQAKTGQPPVQGALTAGYQPTMPAEMDSVHQADEPAPGFLLDDLLGVLPKIPARMGSPGIDKSIESSALGLLPARASGLERESIVHDTELEEAAILFANGDDAGAEDGLLEILRPGASHFDHVYTWLALFDLYRATGEQGKFEAAALDFAEHFSRSAPQWFSLPDMVKALIQPGEKPGHESVAADWICPSVLSMQSVGVLNTAIARSPMPWRLDWSYLKTIESAALGPLHKVFSNWAAQPVQLRFRGDVQLQKVLLEATPSGERDTEPKWWMLRMEMLRIIHRPDDFELTALDFCVTYEVSPPAWEVARCDYKSLDDEGDAMGRATIIGEPTTETVYSTLMELEGDSGIDFPSSVSIRSLSVDLSGQIQGEAADVLNRLETSLMGADRMQISCAKLIRVDFSAAGMLLNWVSARRAENRCVEFSEVNRLVAAFFNVIGIVEYAKVSPRSD